MACEEERPSMRPLAVLFAALLLVPLAWLVWMASAFRGLSPEALDLAQVARHLAQGDGFVTSAIPPLSLELVPRVAGHPDLIHPPLFPLWESLLFRLSGARPALAALASGTAWMLLVPLLYALGKRLFNREVAAFAVALFAVNIAALRFSISGLPHLVAALEVSLLLAVLAGPAPAGEGTAAARLPWWRMALSGALAGVIWLTDRGLAWPVIGATALFWARAAKRACPAPADPGMDEGEYDVAGPSILEPKGFLCYHAERLRGNAPLHAVSLVLAAALVVALPWLVRNGRVSGHPLANLDAYEVLTRTADFPGQSVYRRFEADLPAPCAYAAAHPLRMARKALAGLDGLFPQLLSLAGAVGLLLFAAACLRPPRDASARRLQYYLFGMLIAHAAWLTVTSARFDRLVAFLPAMALFGIAAAHRLACLIERGSTSIGPPWWMRARVAPLWIAVLIAAAPLVTDCLLPRAWPNLEPTANVAYLRQQLPEGAAALTDAPWLVAWHGDRPAVWLPQEEADLRRLEARGLKPAWLYLSRHRGGLGADEIADWWLQVLHSPLGYRTYLPHPSRARGEVLLKRYAEADRGK